MENNRVLFRIVLVREGQFSLTAIANPPGLSVSRVSRIVSMVVEQANGKA